MLLGNKKGVLEFFHIFAIQNWPMRYLCILLLFSMFGYSQTNEAIINQAKQAAESQNIINPAQAVRALEASGMTEAQARKLAAERGLSYDQLLNDYFSDLNSENPEENLDSEDAQDNEDSKEKEEEKEEERR